MVAGMTYSFSPTAADGDGDLLTFSVTGLPAWASFETASGKLSGTPTLADLGTSTVTIRVTDGAADASLATFSITVVPVASGSAVLSWQPPTTNTDGSALTDLAGFEVYWSTNEGDLANSVMLRNGGLTSYVVESLTPAKWYFAITAINSSGRESGRSVVASKTVL
jgi:hypothetical protein